MPFDVTASMRALESHLLSSGRFVHVQVGEPKAVVDSDGFVAALMMDHAQIVSLTMSTTIELHVVTIRIYKNMLAEPQDQWEIDGAKIYSEVSDLLYADFTLGGQVRNIDFGGEHGSTYQAIWAYGDIGGPIFRVVDITVPLVVDGATTLAP